MECEHSVFGTLGKLEKINFYLRVCVCCVSRAQSNKTDDAWRMNNITIPPANTNTNVYSFCSVLLNSIWFVRSYYKFQLYIFL